MKVWLAAGAGAVVGAVVMGVLVFALDTGNSARSAGATPPRLTTSDCLEIIPDSVFESLGWSAGHAATEDVARCEKLGEQGSVTVGDRAIVASSSERAAATEKTYDELCSGLFEKPGVTPDLQTDWLPEDTTACAALLPPDRGGVAEVYLHLTDSHEVIQIRVVSLNPLSDDRLKAGLAELVSNAQRQW